MNLLSAEGTASLHQLFHAILEIQSGIFAVLGILLGAWLSRRSELMRLRVERRTQIFDEACRVTAEYYSLLWHPFGLLAPAATMLGPDPREITEMSLDRKIEAHFSRSAYTAWRAVHIETLRAKLAEANFGGGRGALDALQKEFHETMRVALDAIAKEIK
jgi:hypothetical protein